jgi:NAD(P)-dependent dehydrogenase (short-subunit alcohol dehydrogenase family)
MKLLYQTLAQLATLAPVECSMRPPAPARYDYTGRTVLVTGGVRGVGAGIARRFLAAGARVVTSSRHAVALDGAHHLTADVRDPEQVQALVDAVVERFGGVDVLVNNAGGTPPTDAATTPPRLHHKIVELNLLAPLHVAQAANAVMQGQDGGGAIIMIGSVSGQRPSPGTAAYGAAKAGLEHLARSLAIEWAPAVRVNTVTVGLVATEQAHLHYGDVDGVAAVAATVPLGRMASPEDVGDACLFLGSAGAAYVTGAALLVHGGGERPAFLGAANAERTREETR